MLEIISKNDLEELCCILREVESVEAVELNKAKIRASTSIQDIRKKISYNCIDFSEMVEMYAEHIAACDNKCEVLRKRLLVDTNEKDYYMLEAYKVIVAILKEDLAKYYLLEHGYKKVNGRWEHER